MKSTLIILKCGFELKWKFLSIIYEKIDLYSKFELRLGAQSSYFVKYFEGSNAGKTMTMRN